MAKRVKIDMDLVDRMAEAATAACIRDFDKIEKGLPRCCRSTPVRPMSPARQERFLQIIGDIESRRAAASIST